MEQIKFFSPVRLRNEEAFGFFKLVESLLPHLLKNTEPENPDIINVEGGVSALSADGEPINAILEAPINSFEEAVWSFDKTLESNSKDSTEVLTCEEWRDKQWRVNNAYVKAMTSHPNPEMAAIAERVKAEFDKYGDVTGLSAVQESGALHNLFQDIRTIPAQDRIKIHYEEWFNALETAENNYQAAVAARTDVRAEKEVGAVKRTRLDAEAAYAHLVEVVNLLAKLEGDTDYLPFISRMNVLIAEQRATLKSRQTRAANAKEEATPEPTEPEPENPDVI